MQISRNLSSISRRIVPLLGLVIAAPCVLEALPAHAQTYVVKDLGILPGISQTGTQGIMLSIGLSVNDIGQVAGVATDNSPYHSFLSAPHGGTLQDLGGFGGESGANGVNDAGQVSGYSSTAANNTSPKLAYLYTPGMGLKSLGTLGGANSYGEGINAFGQVAGFADVTGNGTFGTAITHAFLSGVNGGALQDLGTLGGNNSFGYSVNADGAVTGYSELGSTPGQYSYGLHAFLSGADGRALQDLGTLGGNYSFGYSVNRLGQVVGDSTLTGDQSFHAFLSGADGGALQDLGTLGGANSYASGINDAGQVVGESDLTSGSTPHGFLFSDGVLKDLNSLLVPGSDFTIGGANSISDAGFITGFGYDASGNAHAFLLSPVPEASTTVSFGLLLALGMGGMVIAAKKKKTASA